MGEESVALEDCGNGAVIGTETVEATAIEDDFAAVGFGEAGDHAEDGCLAATGWAKEGIETALRHVEGDAVNDTMGRERFHESREREGSFHYRLNKVL